MPGWKTVQAGQSIRSSHIDLLSDASIADQAKACLP